MISRSTSWHLNTSWNLFSSITVFTKDVGCNIISQIPIVNRCQEITGFLLSDTSKVTKWIISCLPLSLWSIMFILSSPFLANNISLTGGKDLISSDEHQISDFFGRDNNILTFGQRGRLAVQRFPQLYSTVLRWWQLRLPWKMICKSKDCPKTLKSIYISKSYHKTEK